MRRWVALDPGFFEIMGPGYYDVMRVTFSPLCGSSPGLPLDPTLAAEWDLVTGKWSHID